LHVLTNEKRHYWRQNLLIMFLMLEVGLLQKKRQVIYKKKLQTAQTSGCHVVKTVRLRTHHNLEADDGEAIDVSALSASRWRKVLSQYLRRRPQLAYAKNTTVKQWNISFIMTPIGRLTRQRMR